MTSYFWRNIPQQNVVFKTILELAERQRPVRVLDIGSSSGEAILTYAILLREHYGDEWAARVKITCVEPHFAKCARFRHGCYLHTTLHQMPEPIRAKYLTTATLMVERPDGQVPQLLVLLDLAFQAAIDLHQCTFADFTPNSNYDIVFCQNTLFHLEPKQAMDVVQRVAGMLPVGGYFVCGGRDVETGADLRANGFVPAPVDHEAIYRGWIQRQNMANARHRLKPYSTSDPDWPYKIASVFIKT